jgi:pimeloyl-ACP methyl ester carboxylesterase
MRGVAVTCRPAFERRRLMGLVAAALMLAASAGTASASTGVSCTTYSRIPVALAAGAPLSYSVSGELCARPGELARGATVQLLIHGATYDRSYWDFGRIDGIRYSYARDVAAAGYPTFAIDEIGTGASSHPASTQITIQTAAYVAHEIVQGLLDGSVAHVRFSGVIEVGHSVGSLTAIEEAATFHDVAGVIVTGNTHITPTFHSVVAANQYPASEDPKFAGRGLDSGYLTTAPGTRGLLFSNAADADPAVIAADEAGKDVISATELGSALATKTTSISLQINVPVLLIDGSQDPLDCGSETDGQTFDCSTGQAIATQEAPYYSAATDLRACSIPGSGHDINLALNHVLEEADAIAWSYEYVGQTPLGTIKSHQLPPDCSPS